MLPAQPCSPFRSLASTRISPLRARLRRAPEGRWHNLNYFTSSSSFPSSRRRVLRHARGRRQALGDWLLPRVLELTYTAWDLEPFARDVGYDGPPFRWDPERRFLLRCELDAAFFHLYGLSRDDTDYVMDTFPIVRKNDEKAHGEYRTKRVILEIYDAMAEAARTGHPTRPASTRHPPTRASRIQSIGPIWLQPNG